MLDKAIQLFIHCRFEIASLLLYLAMGEIRSNSNVCTTNVSLILTNLSQIHSSRCMKFDRNSCCCEHPSLANLQPIYLATREKESSMTSKDKIVLISTLLSHLNIATSSKLAVLNCFLPINLPYQPIHKRTMTVPSTLKTTSSPVHHHHSFSNFDSKLFQIFIILNIRIHRLTNDSSPLIAKLLGPFRIFVLDALDLFLLAVIHISMRLCPKKKQRQVLNGRKERLTC